MGAAASPGGASRPAALQVSFPASSIQVRPLTRRLARRNLDRVAVVVQALDQTVDPSVAECFAHEVFIRYRLDARVLLMADEPDAGARRVVRREPPPPVCPRSARPGRIRVPAMATSCYDQLTTPDSLPASGLWPMSASLNRKRGEY